MKSYRRLRNSEPIENTRFSDCEKSISPQKCQFLRFQILVEMWITFSHYTIFSNHSRFIPYKAYSFVKNFKSYPHQSHFEFRNHLMKSYKCCFCCSMKSMTIPIIHVFVHNFNPSCTKRHFLPLFGQFVNIFLNSLKMQGSCNPADNIIPIEIHIEYICNWHTKSNASTSINIITSTAVIIL